jgi:hypothetical protein
VLPHSRRSNQFPNRLLSRSLVLYEQLQPLQGHVWLTAVEPLP